MFLGGFLLGQTITFGVTWTPDVGQPAISGSTLTLRHSDGTVVGPIDGVGAGNVWSTVVEPTKTGRWEVQWVTTPDGGVTDDEIYVS